MLSKVCVFSNKINIWANEMCIISELNVYVNEFIININMQIKDRKGDIIEMYDKKAIGKYGEDMACDYLKHNEYYILERNFNCKQGEIDIVAYDNKSNEIVFIEVKTRTNFNYGFPSEAVNKLKQKHILNCVKYYLYCKRLEDRFIRIDVIEIVLSKKVLEYKINHLKSVL